MTSRYIRQFKKGLFLLVSIALLTIAISSRVQAAATEVDVDPTTSKVTITLHIDFVGRSGVVTETFIENLKSELNTIFNETKDIKHLCADVEFVFDILDASAQFDPDDTASLMSNLSERHRIFVLDVSNVNNFSRFGLYDIKYTKGYPIVAAYDATNGTDYKHCTWYWGLEYDKTCAIASKFRIFDDTVALGWVSNDNPPACDNTGEVKFGVIVNTQSNENYQVIAHEFAHIAGSAHIDDVANLMYPEFHDGNIDFNYDNFENKIASELGLECKYKATLSDITLTDSDSSSSSTGSLRSWSSNHTETGTATLIFQTDSGELESDSEDFSKITLTSVTKTEQTASYSSEDVAATCFSYDYNSCEQDGSSVCTVECTCGLEEDCTWTYSLTEGTQFVDGTWAKYDQQATYPGAVTMNVVTSVGVGMPGYLYATATPTNSIGACTETKDGTLYECEDDTTWCNGRDYYDNDRDVTLYTLSGSCPTSTSTTDSDSEATTSTQLHTYFTNNAGFGSFALSVYGNQIVGTQPSFSYDAVAESAASGVTMDPGTVFTITAGQLQITETELFQECSE